MLIIGLVKVVVNELIRIWLLCPCPEVWQCVRDEVVEPSVGEGEAEDRQKVLSGDPWQEDVLYGVHTTEHRVDEEDCPADLQHLTSNMQVDCPVVLMLSLVIKLVVSLSMLPLGSEIRN